MKTIPAMLILFLVTTGFSGGFIENKRVNHSKIPNFSEKIHAVTGVIRTVDVSVAFKGPEIILRVDSPDTLADLNGERAANLLSPAELERTVKAKSQGRATLSRVQPEKHSMTPKSPRSRVSRSEKESIIKKLKELALEFGLEPRLVLSMAKVESGYNPHAISPSGAIGVLQVMPRFAWREFKIPREKLFDPEVNIRVGLSWLKSHLERFSHDIDLSLAAYNAGASRVVRAGWKVPPIKETQAYVKKVKDLMKNGI